MTALLQKMTSRASHSHHSTSIAQTPLPTDGGGWSDPRCSPSCCWGVLVFQRPPTAPAPSRSRIRLGALGSPSSAPAPLLLAAPAQAPEQLVFLLSAIYTNTGTSKTGALQIWHFEASAKWGNVDKEEKKDV